MSLTSTSYNHAEKTNILLHHFSIVSMVYNQMRKYAWKVVYSAKESYGRKFGVRLENEAGKGNLFKAAKRVVRQGKDIV